MEGMTDGLPQAFAVQLLAGAAVHIFHTVAGDSPGKHRTVVPLPREAYASLTLEVTWLIP